MMQVLLVELHCSTKWSNLTTAIRDYFNAAIVAAYDYYPYGMLMPDRFVSDTATHCVTTTQTHIVPIKTSTSVLASAIAINGGTLSSSSSGSTIDGATGGMQIDIPVTAGLPIDISIDVSYIYGSFISLSLSEDIGLGTYKPLANTNTNYPGSITLSATPGTTTVRLSINMMSSYLTPPPGGLFSISAAASEKITYTPQNVLVTLCNKGADKYEFGFNTQMKSNEVAGIGNWNTAAFWEYNTRTGVRANRDPVFVPWESPYSVNHSNPIGNSDPNGDYSKGVAAFKNFVMGGNGIAQNQQTGEWGYLPKGANKYKYADPPQNKPDGNRAATSNDNKKYEQTDGLSASQLLDLGRVDLWASSSSRALGNVIRKAGAKANNESSYLRNIIEKGDDDNLYLRSIVAPVDDVPRIQIVNDFDMFAFMPGSGGATGALVKKGPFKPSQIINGFQKMGNLKGSGIEKLPGKVAKEVGVDVKKFSDYYHNWKKANGRGNTENADYQKLKELAEKFKNENK